MDVVTIILAFVKDIYRYFTSIDFLRALSEGTGYLLNLLYGKLLGWFRELCSFCKPIWAVIEQWYNAYNQAEEAFMEELGEFLYIFLWKCKVDFAEFTSQYLTAFTVDDFQFFKHHWDDPWAVRTHWWYEDIEWYLYNFCFHVKNFIEYHILPVFNDFCYEYYISTTHLTYWGVCVFGLVVVWVLYDYFKTLLEVQVHMYRVESMQILAITEYLRNNKILVKNKKLQDSFEDRQYNAWGYDRELFIETLQYDKTLQEELRKVCNPFMYSKTAEGLRFAENVAWKNENKVEESDIFKKPASDEVVVDWTIDPIKRKHTTTANNNRFCRFPIEFVRRWYLADAIHLFEILESKEIRFLIVLSNLLDFPRNFIKLWTLFFWGLKTLIAVSWPTRWTHFDVDYKIYLDLHSAHQLEQKGRIAFNNWVLNYLHEFYVQYMKDPSIDVDVVVARYIEYKLKSVWNYRKKCVRLEMKEETFFFFGLRLQLVLDVMELKSPLFLYFRRSGVIVWNFFRCCILYILRIWWRFFKMPLFEDLEEMLVRHKLKRIISPLEEASCFGYVPSNARDDVIGYIRYLDDNNIMHWFHVAHYKGGKKKSYFIWLKEFILQFLQIDLFFPRNLVYKCGIEPYWVNRYDMAFKYTLRRSFVTYLTARIYMPFIFFIRKYIYHKVNHRIKNFFRQTWTWEMYMMLTFWRFWYETSIYRMYKIVLHYLFYGADAMPFRYELPPRIKANSKYTRKLSLETMADKNQHWFYFYFPMVAYNMIFMEEQLYLLFAEEDEEIYTHEEDWLETDYKEDHDSLFESDFQLRKNWQRDLQSWYALINEELGIGKKRDKYYDFYVDSEQLWGSDISKYSINLSWVPLIQNTRLPVRNTYNKQKLHYVPKRAYDPYRLDYHLRNWGRAFIYEEEIEVMEKEALYMLYYWVNSPLNGFFTHSTELDDGSYYSYNTIFKDADLPLNEEEYAIYPYQSAYAYGPYGLLSYELPVILMFPDLVLTNHAKRYWRISKRGRSRLGRWSYYKSLTQPLFYSTLLGYVTSAIAGNKMNDILDNLPDNLPDNVSDNIKDNEQNNVQDVNIKVRARFEMFLDEHKDLQAEFNELLRSSYTEAQLTEYKLAEHLFIGTDMYMKELETLTERKKLLAKYFGEFRNKLKDK